MANKRNFSGRQERSGQKTNKRAGNKAPKVKRSSAVRSEEKGTRLNKYIAGSGICSRRQADDLISAGLVEINGKIVTELGTRVMPGDQVKYNGERLKSERLVYILLNKPKDYVTTLKDPHAEKTVIDLVGKACKERVYPVGRLDKNTTGVLLLTNDGDLAKKLTHPRHEKIKIYHVSLDKNYKGSDLKQLIDGEVVLDDGPVQVDALSYTDANDKSRVGVEIHSGRNRIVRRMFEHQGYKVRKLDRVYFAGLTKKGLTRGHWRFLTEAEIGMLKMGSYK